MQRLEACIPPGEHSITATDLIDACQRNLDEKFEHMEAVRLLKHVAQLSISQKQTN